MEDMEVYFSGKLLYGDDFTTREIEQWYQDEQEAFTDMYVRPEGENYQYPYHALDARHFYKRFPLNFKIDHALGIGSATGDEFQPILDRITQISILEPSDLYQNWNNIKGVPARWIKPEISGDIKFENDTFDLITCFSALHHIPNVSYVLSECARVLKPGGFLLIREPITSMGDWRLPRIGVTKRERGIPLEYFHEIFNRNNLLCLHETLCNFPLVDLVARKLFRVHPYNSAAWVTLDTILSKAFSWHYHYHRVNVFQKIAPRSICLTLTKNS